MSALPSQYQQYAAQGQRHIRPAEVELYGEADPIVHVPDPYDPTAFVAVRRSQLQPATPTPPRDLAPQPLLDPQAQRILAGGVSIGAAGAGVGWGFGQMAAGIAMMGGSGLAILLGLLLAAASMRGRGVTHVRQEVHQHAGWFGKNTTTM
jgi:hypothetical protein